MHDVVAVKSVHDVVAVVSYQHELSAPSVRALNIFDIAQVTPTKTLQLRHAVLGPG